MHTRLRLTLLLLALGFLVVGVAALTSTVWNTYDVVSSNPTIDSNGNVIDSGSSGPTKTYLMLSIVLPAVGVVGIVLSVICFAGLVLSFVLVDALGARRPVGGAAPDDDVDASNPSYPSGSPFGPPEVLDAPGSQ